MELFFHQGCLIHSNKKKKKNQNCMRRLFSGKLYLYIVTVYVLNCNKLTKMLNSKLFKRNRGLYKDAEKGSEKLSFQFR